MKSILEKRRTSLEITSTDLNEQLNASFRTFDRLLAKTRGLFDMSSCDMWPLEQLLGKSNSDLEKISNYLISNLVIWFGFCFRAFNQFSDFIPNFSCTHCWDSGENSGWTVIITNSFPTRQRNPGLVVFVRTFF